jgi:hypothetical protein
MEHNRIKRFNENSELNSELSKETSSSISDVRKSKLNNGIFYLIQEDGGDQLHFTGIYDNLESFTNDIKDKISQKENIDISEIKIEFEGIESYPGSQKSDTILVKYKYSEDIFYYEEISINEIYPV